MPILERPRLLPQERFDLEDWETLLSGLRTDSNFYNRLLMAETSYIVRGFIIAQSYIDQTAAEIDITDGLLLNTDSSTDYSWWAAPSGTQALTIPVGAEGLQSGRNYIEIQLTTATGTPLERAFWNPTANGGLGVEFTQQVDTVTYLTATVHVNQIAFNDANPDRIPIAIIDMDGSGVIKSILDRRKLLFRAGLPGNLTNAWTWGSRVEPATTLTFTMNASGSFTVGEEVTFSGGATATVVTGGLNNITVKEFSSLAFDIGDTVTGGTSGSVGTLDAAYESFEGADKDIHNFRDMILALMSGVRDLRGTTYWYEVGNVGSLPSLLNYINSIIAPVAVGAAFKWSGTALSITDQLQSGQATSDVIAKIVIPGDAGDLYLTRQDGAGGSTALTIPDDYILYVEFPAAGASRSWSDAGTGATNFVVVPKDDFIPTDKNYWLAYRTGTKVVINGTGELDTGEQTEIGDQVSKETLAYIGAATDTSTEPQYTTTPSADLSNQFTTADSLTQAISINAANLNDVASGMIRPYRELLSVVASAANDNEVTGPVTTGSTLTLPNDSRNSDLSKSYLVGAGQLLITLNGQWLQQGDGFAEIGSPDDLATTFQILTGLVVGDVLEIMLINPAAFGTAALGQGFFVHNITGQNGLNIPVGGLYNMGTEKLQTYRNGLCSQRSASVGVAEDRFTEATNNSVTIYDTADPVEVFTFINHTVAPSFNTLQTGVTGVTLTIPTYVMGAKRLRVYRNGVLMSDHASTTPNNKYTEASTTTITLAVAAVVADVFQFFYDGVALTFRTQLTGTTGTTLTIPGGNTYTLGTKKLLVFRNGVLMLESLTLGDITDRYQQDTISTIVVADPAVTGDMFEFLYIA